MRSNEKSGLLACFKNAVEVFFSAVISGEADMRKTRSAELPAHGRLLRRQSQKCCGGAAMSKFLSLLLNWILGLGASRRAAVCWGLMDLQHWQCFWSVFVMSENGFVKVD